MSKYERHSHNKQSKVVMNNCRGNFLDGQQLNQSPAVIERAQSSVALLGENLRMHLYGGQRCAAAGLSLGEFDQRIHCGIHHIA